MRFGGLVVAAALACSALVVAADARSERSLLVWCFGETFPYAALSNPVGAEDADTEPAALLRAFVQNRPDLHLPADGWRLIAATENSALFVHGRRHEPLFFSVIRAELGNTGIFAWGVNGVGQCRGRAALRRVRGRLRATPWRLAPETKLSTRTRVLPLLARMEACPADFERPFIRYERRSVRIAIFIRPRRPGGPDTCEGNVDTPYTLRLSSPLGKRWLMDAGFVPACHRYGPPPRSGADRRPEPRRCRRL